MYNSAGKPCEVDPREVGGAEQVGFSLTAPSVTMYKVADVSVWNADANRATFTVNGITKSLYNEKGTIYNGDGNVVGSSVDGHMTMTSDWYNSMFGNGSSTGSTTVNINQSVTSVRTRDGSNVTVNVNAGTVKEFITGDSSHTVINNRSIIETITTGKNSSLVLNNSGTINQVRLGENGTAEIYNHGDIESLVGGDVTDKYDRGMNIFNFNYIGNIYTGLNSKNFIFNDGEINFLETGVGNNSNMQGNDAKNIKKGDGSNLNSNTQLNNKELRSIEDYLNNRKVSKDDKQRMLNRLNQEGIVIISIDKWTGKYVATNRNKTYWDEYHAQIRANAAGIIYGVNVSEEYGRYVMAAHSLGITDMMGLEEYVNTSGSIWKVTEKNRSIQGLKEAVSLGLGFTPVDIYFDTLNLIEGKDVITGQKSNRIVLALCIIAPEVIDKLLKGGLKQSDILAQFKSSTYKYKHNAPKNTLWKDVVESTKSGPAKYKYGTDIGKLELEALQKGKFVNNGKAWKVFDAGNIVGAKDGIQTQYIRVEISPDGTFHSHHITPQEYKKYTK